MKALANIWRRIRSSKVVRIIINRYVVATIIFLVIVTVVDSDNVFRWAKEKMVLNQQEKLVKYYENQIHMTDLELKHLTSDKDSLEQFARQRYYFQEEDEDIFLVEP